MNSSDNASEKYAHVEQWVQIDDDRKKYVHSWGDAESPKKICIVHGLGEHGGRYHRLAAELVESGAPVVAFDQQGHGRSGEERGCIESYDAVLDDIEAILRWVRSEREHSVTLLGHSMGGNLVLNYALRREHLPDAVISSSPMIRAANPPDWFTERLLRLLLMIRPNLTLKKVNRPERIMSDPFEQSLLRDDELFHSQLSLRLGAALLDSGNWLIESEETLTVPTLLSHGTNDRLTCPDASKEFATQAGEHCRLEILEGHMHDPFRDEGRETVVEMFKDFINQHSGKTFEGAS